MKRIGKIWIMLVMAMFLVSNALAIDIDDSGIPFTKDSHCVRYNPIDATDAFDAGEWSPEKWSYPQAKDWSVSVMGLRVGADGNIAVRFIMTQEDINFFRNAKFSGTNVRVPFAIEIDVVDHDNAFGFPGIEDFTVDKGNVPNNAGLIEDISNYDSINNLGAIIMHPAELEADTVYQIVFSPDQMPKYKGVVHVNFQLTVNYKWIAAMVNGESTKCDVLDFMGDFRDSNVGGYDLNVENNSDYSNVPSKAIDPWYYYLAAKNDSSNNVGFELYRENHAVCWNEHENSEHNLSSYFGDDGEHDHLVSYKGRAIKDWCILDDNEINLWRLEIGSKYYYNHTTMPEDNTGKTPPNPNPESTPEIDTTPSDNRDSGYVDPYAGYDHHVGLKYVKIGKKSSGKWKGSVTYTEGQIPTKRDFRVKLKRKADQWKDCCAKIYFSHNKYFSQSKDTYLGKECKKLSKDKYDKYNEKSIYVKGIRLPHNMEGGKNYYFFTVVEYSGGKNYSTRTDKDECVKVDVEPKPRYNVLVRNPSISLPNPALSGATFSVGANIKNELDSTTASAQLKIYGTGISNNGIVLENRSLGTMGKGASKNISFSKNLPNYTGTFRTTIRVSTDKSEVNNTDNYVVKDFTVVEQINGKINHYLGSTDEYNPLEVEEELTEGSCFKGTSTELIGMGLSGNSWEWTCQGSNGGTDETGYSVLMGEGNNPDESEIRADVNQDGNVTTTDAMLIARYIDGGDMSETAWVDTPTTGDVNCDNTVDSTDKTLVMYKSMGFDVSGDGWCAEE